MLGACDERPQAGTPPSAFTRTGAVHSSRLDEISGIQAGSGGHWLVQNDSGKPIVHVIDLAGKHLAAIEIIGARNRDWEALAAVDTADGRLLVIGDTGDNLARHKSIRLYFVIFPEADAAGRYPQRLALQHTVKLEYPDGPRDSEAMAYDPSSGMLLLLSKRDGPPRLYGIDAKQALQADKKTLEYLGVMPGLRPPSPRDLILSPDRGAWVSQPTGMDISSDGQLAAVITYRSLYLFRRENAESWPEAFSRAPQEFVGPPGLYEEAVGFSRDQSAIIVATERLPAPLYRLSLPASSR